MKTTYSINGNRISKKEVIDLVGKARHDRMLKDAQEAFMEDPMIENDYMVSSGILNISFKW